MTEPHLRCETIDAEKLGEFVDAGQVYAIVDAACGETVLAKLVELGPVRATCLFRGPTLEQLWAVAPYLVSVDRAFFDWLRRTVWSEPWGILAMTDAPPRKLFIHLRNLLVVEDPVGETVYFRYYDPRVLKVFLPTCNTDQIELLFGPVIGYLAAADSRVWSGALERTQSCLGSGPH